MEPRSELLGITIAELSNVENESQSTECTSTSSALNTTAESQYIPVTHLDLDVLSMKLKLKQLFKRICLDY